MEYQNSIPLSMWAAEDRPDYKIEHNDIRDMTTSELLSIVIGAGTNKMNTVDIARKLLNDNDCSLKKLSAMSVNDISKAEGIGIATARRIKAALELGVRMMTDRREDMQNILTASRVYNVMYPIIAHLEYEEFWVLYANQAGNVLKKKRVAQGGISEVYVDLRLILKDALLVNATIIVVCHNHPSGSLIPSKPDDELTKSIRTACNAVSIRLYDHVIVSEEGFYSYREQGKL